tara:strand:+ start:413 stop:1561 length:1149 start_codon:yes stop_codon:yes gene_type:complete
LKKLAIITTHPIQYQIPLFKDLKKKGVDVSVFFASKHGYTLKKIDPEFLKKIKWNNDPNMLNGYKSYFPKKQIYSINNFKLSFSGIEKYLIKENFQYVLILGWNNLHYLKSFYLAFRQKIKVILRVETNLNLKSNIFKKIIKYIALKFLFRNISYFLSIGKLNKKFYLHHNVDYNKIFPAPYFVDNKFFKINLSKENFKKKLKVKNKKIILFVGKLIERKNPIEFLELAKLYKYETNFHFIMIGDGNLKSECKKFVKKNKLKNVSLLGFVNQTEIKKYYKITDLLIVTSLYETWGLTINEAFCFKIPVICTSNCGASMDLINNGKTGFVYSSGELLELRNKVSKILNNNKLSKIMSNNIGKIIKKYTLKETTNSILNILNES